MDEDPGHRVSQGRERAEVDVVPLPFAGQRRVQRVVHVVVPLSRHAQATGAGRLDRARVVEVGLGDQRQRPAQRRSESSRLVGQLGQQRPTRGVVQLVHRVEPQRIEVEGREPVQRATQDPAAYLGAARTVQVDRRPPRRLGPLGEVRPEPGQVVAARPEVVLDDVEADGEPAPVCRIDETLQRRRPAVPLVHRPRMRAVVPPAPAARERTQRHQLDDVDPEVHQMIEPKSAESSVPSVNVPTCSS